MNRKDLEEEIRKVLEEYNINLEQLGLTGIAQIKEKDSETGEVISEQVVHNTIVGDNGLEFVAQAILDAGVTDDWSHIIIGSDGTSPNEDQDSILDYEDGEDVSGVKQLIEFDNYDAVVQFGPATFSSGAGKSSIEEACIADADDPTASIFNRLTFNAINNEDNDLEITIYIDVGGRGYSP